MAQHTIGALTIVESGPTTHLGMTSVDFPTNAELSGNDSGAIYEEFQAITGFSPVATLSSKCVAELISMIGLNGQCVGTGKAITQVDVISRKVETCQTALGSTPHVRDRVTAGLLRLGSLTADRGQDATLSVILDTLTAEGNAPVARTDGVAMVTPVVAERLTLGLCSIAGSTWPEVEGVSLDFNVSIGDKTPALGAIWADTVSVLTVRPVLTIRGRDLSKVSAALIAATSNAATHANTIIQLIRRKSGAAFEPFGNSVHTTITMAGMLVPDNLVSAAANQRATTTLRLAGAFDGTNAPVMFNVATTYDTTPG